MIEEGCLCHKCGEHYRIDLILPTPLWSTVIRLRQMTDNALATDQDMLCGMCIMQYLESIASMRNEYGFLIVKESLIN